MMLLRSLAFLFSLIALTASAAEPDLLEPDQAFRFAARAAAADSIEVLYRSRPGTTSTATSSVSASSRRRSSSGRPNCRRASARRDEFFGEVETYRGEVRIRLPLKNAESGDSVTLTAVSQGCADVGVCYVPYEQQARFILASSDSAFSSPAASSLPAGLFAPGSDAGADDRAIARLFHGGLGMLILSFFGFGLLLSLTPCVLPMIPIVSGIIAGRGVHLTRLHGFTLSLSYVLGMAITYAAAGVLAGLSGAMLSTALQNPWVIGTFALIFVVLAGAMFGFYELQLPAALQTRLASATNRLHGGHFAGVFAMGALSALIVGPCVAAPLAGALLYISQSRDTVLGGSALFAMALGMGVPLLVVGASAGTLLPKAGPWMQTVQRFFGVLLLAVAVYLITPLVPVAWQMLAWAALLIITAMYLRAIDPLPAGARGIQRFAKGAGLIALVAGIAFVVGALSGSRDILQPLSGLLGDASTRSVSPVPFNRVSSPAELDRAVNAARGRPVMLDFYADWCVSCKEMERYTFSDPEVRKRLEALTKLQADVTANTAEHQALLQRFRLFGPPGIVFFDREGREIAGLRVIGFQPAERFAAVLDQALATR